MAKRTNHKLDKKNDIKNEQANREQRKPGMKKDVLDNIWGVILVALGIFLVFALQLHKAGEFGDILDSFLKGMLGMVAFILPWYLLVLGILLLANKTSHLTSLNVSGFIIILLMFCLINCGRFIDPQHIYFDMGEFYRKGIELKSGGLIGMPLSSIIVKYLGKIGLYVISLVVISIFLLLIINTPISKFISDSRERRRKRKEYRLSNKSLKSNDEFSDLKAENSRDDVHDVTINLTSPLESDNSNDKDFLDLVKNNEELGNQKKKKLRDKILGFRKTIGINKSELEEEFDTTESDPQINTYGGSKDGQSKIEDNEKNNITYGIEKPSEIRPGFGLQPQADVENKSRGIGDINDTYKPQYNDANFFSGGFNADNSDKTKSEPASDDTKETIGKIEKRRTKKYKKPPIYLLNMPVKTGKRGVNSELRKKAEILESTLRSFNVDASVVEVTQGPAVTRYEIQPNVGVKVNSIVRLADDIALNLRAKSIRIEAPIPGKAAVGIEVENEKINMVTVREVIESKEFKEAESNISVALGRDIAGRAIVPDLRGMPHLLIAGSTGSGKSVCINSIITSILYRANPDDVKLILIDPKVVELGNYNGIPHLLIPVVTDPAKAAAALNWAVAEMTKRYKMFAEVNARDLKGYNRLMRSKGDEDKLLPQIVIIIDELADLMMASPASVEDSICRLAQLARAAGMHLIVATQRPSVDVITGLIKANIPSRIAFAVSSHVDSRTILDMGGAEKLVGKGDMLFCPLDKNKPTRVQGCFISDEEVERVLEYVKKQYKDTEYSEDVMGKINKTELGKTDDKNDLDELYEDAVRLVIDEGQASVSMLQRRFRIGYNRAARIVDEMERRGIVGPQDGSRPREVIVTEYKMNSSQETPYTKEDF